MSVDHLTLAKATPQDLEALVLAHRYLYYVVGAPVITDQNYDRIVRLAVKEPGVASPVHSPGYPEAYYSDQVKELAIKMLERWWGHA